MIHLRRGGLIKMRRVVSAASAALMVAGCASKASDIAPSYVSPIQYDAYNCQQLAEEAQRISAHAAEAAGAQDSQATRDAVATTAAIVVFWPAAFFVGGDKQNAAELARLRGEMDAIEQTSIRKKCGIQFRQAAAASPSSTPH
jgi:thiamine biosynthesis protein ThiC